MADPRAVQAGLLRVADAEQKEGDHPMLVVSKHGRRAGFFASRLESRLAAPWRRSCVPRMICAAAALLSIAAVLAGCGGAGVGSQSGSRTPPSRFDGSSADGLAAPNFALHDQDGHLVRLSAERGRYVLITFLYVHCRNVCPIIAGQLNGALRLLGSARKDVRVLAVSVDPTGDTPAAVRHFIQLHRLLPQFLYLTGTAKTLEPIWRAYHIASTQTSKGLVVGHTAIEVLLDRSGRPRLLYDSHVTAQAVVHDLRALGLAA